MGRMSSTIRLMAASVKGNLASDSGRGVVPLRAWDAVALVLAVLVLALCVYRAANQSLTHDEALTWNRYLRDTLPSIFWSYDANHHVLYTLLARVSVEWLGQAEWAVRFPALLGATLYLGVSLALMRLLLRPGPARLLVFALLSLNPYVMDFLVAARGYGLALGLMMTALYLLVLDDSRRGDPWPVTRRRWILASVAMGLSLAANLTYLLVNLSLASVFIAMAMRSDYPQFPLSSKGRRLGRLALWFALPGPVLATALLGTLLWFHARKAHFYIGVDEPLRAWSELVEAAMVHCPQDWGMSQGMNWLVGSLTSVSLVILGAGISGMCLTLVRRRWRHGRGWPVERSSRWLLALAAVGILGVGMILATRLLGVKYPLPRMALYAIVLSTLAGGLAFQRRRRVHGPEKSIMMVTFWATSFVLLAMYIGGLQVSHFRDWRYDAGMKPVAQALRANLPLAGPPPRLLTHWLHQPSLEYYRLAWGLGPITIQTWDKQPPPGEFDFVILETGQSAGVGWRVLHQDALSGVALAQRWPLDSVEEPPGKP